MEEICERVAVQYKMNGMYKKCYHSETKEHIKII